MKTLRKNFAIFAFLLVTGFIFNYQVFGQNLDVPYVPTPEDVVEKMLDITNVGPGDYVIDLGSGDGRIVIAAAKRGAIGHGIDLNPVRVKEADENAIKAGVANKVVFLEGDLFEADISNATVITMYLLSTVNLKLRPELLEKLRPGTRVVSHSFSMGEWEADEHAVVNSRNVYFWIIPASVAGTWEWSINGERFTMNVQQDFQKLNLNVASGSGKFNIENPVLAGEKISFTAVNGRNGHRYVYHGIVEEGNITGTVQIHRGRRLIENWSATRR
jgi:SAM-dependent methyltransferase